MDDFDSTPQVSTLLTWNELGRHYDGTTSDMLQWLEEHCSGHFNANMNGIWFEKAGDAAWFKLVWKKPRDKDYL